MKRKFNEFLQMMSTQIKHAGESFKIFFFKMRYSFFYRNVTFHFFTNVEVDKKGEGLPSTELRRVMTSLVKNTMKLLM
jgi:hypothetical protein